MKTSNPPRYVTKESHLKNDKSIIKKQHILFILIYLFLSYISTMILFHKEIVFVGHDFGFQMNRVLGLENIFNSPINLAYYKGLASQVNNFYGWLTVYPLFILIKLFHNIALGYTMFIFFLNFLTFVIAHYASFCITKNKRVAFIGAVLYVFSTYRFINVFTRFALGEIIGMTIIPLVFLGVYLILKQEKKGVIILSLSFSLLIYTHVLTAFMVFLFSVLCFIIFCVKNRRNIAPVFFLFLESSILIVFLSLGQLVPLVFSSSYQELSMPIINNLDSESLDLTKYLLLKVWDNSLITITLGIPLTILLFIMLVSAFRIIFKNKTHELENVQYISLFLGVFAFILSSKVFPWHLFQSTPLQNIQFPWRFLGLATMFIAFSSAVYINGLINKFSKKNIITIFLSTVIILGSLTSIWNSRSLPHWSYKQLNSTDISTLYSADHVDYSPIHTPTDTKQLEERYVSSSGIPLKSERVISKNEQLFQFNTEDKEQITLPVFKYQGLVLINNGKKVKYDETKPLITFTSDKGKNNTIVSYDYPVYQKVAWVVSILSFVTVVVFLVVRRFKKIIKKRD